MVTWVTERVQAESEKNAPPLELVPSATAVATPTFDALPKVSRDWAMAPAEQVPATSVCAEEAKASATAAAAFTVSAWVPLVRPVALAVSVGAPLLVSFQ